MSEINCCVDSNTQYFDILDKTDLVRIELLKPTLIIRYGEVLIRGDVSSEPARQQLAYAIRGPVSVV